MQHNRTTNQTLKGDRVMNRVAEKIIRVYRESYRRATNDLTDAERFMEDVRQAFIEIFGESVFRRIVFELAEYYRFDDHKHDSLWEASDLFEPGMPEAIE